MNRKDFRIKSQSIKQLLAKGWVFGPNYIGSVVGHTKLKASIYIHVGVQVKHHVNIDYSVWC